MLSAPLQIWLRSVPVVVDDSDDFLDDGLQGSPPSRGLPIDGGMVRFDSGDFSSARNAENIASQVLRQAGEIRTIRLNQVDLGLPYVKKFILVTARLRALHTLELIGCDGASFLLSKFLEPSYPKLSKLRIVAGNPLSSIPVSMLQQFLAKNKQLTDLSAEGLQGSAFETHCAVFARSLGHCTALKRVMLDGVIVSPKGAQSLAKAIARLPQLEILSLAAGLRSVRLGSSATWKDWAMVMQSKSLNTLIVRRNDTDVGADKFFGCPAASLKSLDLADGIVSDAQPLIDLAQKSQTLEVLNLSHVLIRQAHLTKLVQTLMKIDRKVTLVFSGEEGAFMDEGFLDLVCGKQPESRLMLQFPPNKNPFENAIKRAFDEMEEMSAPLFEAGVDEISEIIN